MNGARHSDYSSQVVSMGDETLAGWSRHGRRDTGRSGSQVDGLEKVTYEITMCSKNAWETHRRAWNTEQCIFRFYFEHVNISPQTGGDSDSRSLKHISYIKTSRLFSHSQSDRVSKPYICKQPVKASLLVRIECTHGDTSGTHSSPTHHISSIPLTLSLSSVGPLIARRFYSITS